MGGWLEVNVGVIRPSLAATREAWNKDETGGFRFRRCIYADLLQ